MLNANLNITKQAVFKDREAQTKATVVNRTTNIDFLSEFNKICHAKEMPTVAAKTTQGTLKERLQPHGMELINFTLTEHMLEEKINEAAREMLAKTESKISNDIVKHTKDLRKHMDQEFKKSQIAFTGMQRELHSTNQNMLKQS